MDINTLRIYIAIFEAIVCVLLLISYCASKNKNILFLLLISIATTIVLLFALPFICSPEVFQ